jgi:hypothetical protein
MCGTGNKPHLLCAFFDFFCYGKLRTAKNNDMDAREVQGVYLAFGYMHTQGYQEAPRLFCLMHTWRLHQQASTSLLTVHGKIYASTTTSSKRPTTPYPRLLVIRIAPALLCLCRASRCVVSPLDFSSVARAGSRRASGHCASRRDYSSSGLHRLYCAYAVHPDAPYRRSTSC